MSKLNKNELIELIAVKGAISKKEAEVQLINVIEGIKQGLEDGNDVAVLGLGTFEIRERAAVIGAVNPRTKEKEDRPATKTVGVKISSKLKELVK